jgi:hypothetical protein
LRSTDHKEKAEHETFEKCSISFKVKSKIPDFERGKARILTKRVTTPVPGSKVQGSEFEKQ